MFQLIIAALFLAVAFSLFNFRKMIFAELIFRSARKKRFKERLYLLERAFKLDPKNCKVARTLIGEHLGASKKAGQGSVGKRKHRQKAVEIASGISPDDCRWPVSKADRQSLKDFRRNLIR